MWHGMRSITPHFRDPEDHAERVEHVVHRLRLPLRELALELLHLSSPDLVELQLPEGRYKMILQDRLLRLEGARLLPVRFRILGEKALLEFRKRRRELLRSYHLLPVCQHVAGPLFRPTLRGSARISGRPHPLAPLLATGELEHDVHFPSASLVRPDL